MLKLYEEMKKKKINPFEIEKDIAETITDTPRRISGLLGRKLTSDKIRKLHCSVTVEVHSFYNEKKGIICLYNTTIVDLDGFRTGLQEEYKVSNVEQETWIKNTQEVLEFVKITSEYTLTMVYPYNERPKHCTKCQKYRHIQARCSAGEHTCRMCTEGHPKD